MKRRTIAMFPAHPAQLWMLRALASQVEKFGDVLWVLRDKDCLLDLARSWNLEYVVLSRAGRGLCSNALELAGNTVRSLVSTHRRRIDLWVTKYGPGNLAARLSGRRSLSFNDDDIDYVPLIAWSSYPFADALLVPEGVRMGRFAARTWFYPGYHELMYLHPDRFRADRSIRKELGLPRGTPYGLIRLVSLQAHHDRGARGLTGAVVRRLIDMVADRARIFISSEGPLPEDLDRHRCPVAPERIHHVLAGARFFVGDSQTMTMESAVLGTPAFRLNSFVGRISVIEQMERYGLAFGFRPGEEERLLQELHALLCAAGSPERFRRRRRAMLGDKGDPLPVFVSAVRRLLSAEPCPAGGARAVVSP